MEFSDHYSFKKSDIDKIVNQAGDFNCEIITTEKDFQRLTNFDQSKIKVMKAELKIIDENKFLKSIIQNEIY